MAKGTKEDPIEISDPSEIRGNLSYVIKKKEKTDGKPPAVGSGKDRREG